MGLYISTAYVDVTDPERRLMMGEDGISRQPYEDDRSKTWLRECWVTVHTAPDTVTRTPHYMELGR